jgi:nitroreductase
VSAVDERAVDERAVDERAGPVLEAIRSRRVTRAFTAERVADEDVRMVVEAARWASSAGNRRINRFLAVRDPGAIARVRAFSPGMLGVPAALVVICTDLERVRVEQVQVERDTSVWVDVGTAAMSMMLAAHALGLGSCPTTSFSRSGVAAALNLPSKAVPEFILQLGHRAHERREMRPGASTKLSLDELLYWERYR